MSTDSLNALREKLIEAIGLDQGWEESAVRMVDNVVLPIIREHEAITLQSEGDNFTIKEPKLTNKSSEICYSEEAFNKAIVAYHVDPNITIPHKSDVTCDHEALWRAIQAYHSAFKPVSVSLDDAKVNEIADYFWKKMLPGESGLSRDMIARGIRPYLRATVPVTVSLTDIMKEVDKKVGELFTTEDVAIATLNAVWVKYVKD